MMFYILMILGIVFITWGIFLEKQSINIPENTLIDEIYNVNQKDHNDDGSNHQVLLLEKRIEALEEMLFTKVLKAEVSKPFLAQEEEETIVEVDSIERYKLIMKYERQNKSLDEIAKLLGINKGEVLLLKNLYKDL